MKENFEALKDQNKKLREQLVMQKDTIRTIRENNNGLFEQNRHLKELVIELKNQKLRDFIERIDMYDFTECEAELVEEIKVKLENKEVFYE